MYTPQTTIAFYTDGVIDHGSAHGVNWHALVWMWDAELELGKYEWHFYGTVVPPILPYAERYPAVALQHTETLFPPALNDLPEGDTGLYDIARSAEFNILSLEPYKPQYAAMLFTDKVEDHGVAHDAYWHTLAWMFNEELNVGKYEWHYYGTPVPMPLPFADRYPAEALQHPASHFPSILSNLPDGDEGLYALAMVIEYNRLSK